MTNQNQNNANDTKKGDASWDQHNKGNEQKNEKQKSTGCGCGCGCNTK